MFSISYRHKTSVKAEINHTFLNAYLLVHIGNDNWHSRLLYYAFAYNTSAQIDTHCSPFELVRGSLPVKLGE